MSSSKTSLLRTKNSTKLVKKFLRRTTDWHTGSEDQEEAAAKNNKRKRQDEHLYKPASEDDILQSHIQRMIATDRTISRPPTKALKKNKHKKSNFEGTLKRLEKEDIQSSKAKEKAKEIMVGNARSNFQQQKIMHERTFNKRIYVQEQKQKRLKKIAKLLTKTKKQLER